MESRFLDVDGELNKRVFRFDDKLGVHGEKVEAVTLSINQVFRFLVVGQELIQ